MSQTPYIVSPQWLTTELSQQPEKYLLIDMSKPGIYTQAHLPNAINVDYNRLVATTGSTDFIPTKEEIEQLLSEIGLTKDRHVIAYDEEGGTRAARFLWILAVAGHQHFSYLDGGIHAWLAQDLPYSSETSQPTASTYTIDALQTQHVATLEDVLAGYQNPNTVIWDARTAEEYLG